MSQGEVFAASSVAIDGRAVLIEGPPGSGKSTLAVKLIDRGATLIGDDAVSLVVDDDMLIASPPPNIAGKLELRNVGLIDLPTTSAPIAMLLSLTADAPRFVDKAEMRDLRGHTIPCLQFDPAIAAAAIRAEWALRRFGLPA